LWQIAGLSGAPSRGKSRGAACIGSAAAAILDYVRHATEEDLDRVETLLADLCELGQLRERKRGYFSWRSKAFLHFHEDSGDIYVDVKLDDKFERMKVSSPAEQAAFLARVRETLARGS